MCRVVKEQAGLKPKQWVRIKRGVFKDDLAQVDYVDVASNQVRLILANMDAPRTDFAGYPANIKAGYVSDIRIFSLHIENYFWKKNIFVQLSSSHILF